MGVYMYLENEKAYAKINLYLDILSKRDDGFHDLLTMMQLVTLCDDVSIKLIPENEIRLTMEACPIDIPKEKNIAYIAAKLFFDNLKVESCGGVEIKIVKRIPAIAGLSGGSADAAAVLRGLNNLYGNPYTVKELCKLGETIGSDIPFNIVGGAQSCTGRGTEMCSVFGISHYFILIACGEGKNSTAEQYKKLDEKFNDFENYGIRQDYHQMLSAFSAGRGREAFKHMYNVFECLYEDNETYKKTKQIMYDNEAMVAMLSGSGPSVFGVFSGGMYAESAQQALAREGIQSFICKPINRLYESTQPGNRSLE